MLSFDLEKFQQEFSESNVKNPMVDSYPIKKENTLFLKGYLNKEPSWDFSDNYYFVEAHGV